MIGLFEFQLVSARVRRFVGGVSATQRWPKWAWALVILVTEPIGGILYLLIGRGNRE